MTPPHLIAALLVLIIWTVVKHALDSEYDDYAPDLAKLLVRGAATLLPRISRARHRDEWLSHLSESKADGHGAGLIRASGFVMAVTGLAVYLRWSCRSQIYRRARITYFGIYWAIFMLLAWIVWEAIVVLSPLRGLYVVTIVSGTLSSLGMFGWLCFRAPVSYNPGVGLVRLLSRRIANRAFAWHDIEMVAMSAEINVLERRFSGQHDLNQAEMMALVHPLRAREVDFRSRCSRRMRRVRRVSGFALWLIQSPSDVLE